MKTEPNVDVISTVNKTLSKFLKTEKKKYNLGEASSNIHQIKADQIHQLNLVLVNMKTEYDNLMREIISKKQETERFGKQIKMIERMDCKIIKRKNELITNANNYQSQIEIRKNSLIQESYTKETLNTILQKLKVDIDKIHKGIKEYEIENEKVIKLYTKENFFETSIKEKVNSIYSKEKKQEINNRFNFNENMLITGYFQSVIDQKMNFLKSSDDRKEKQKRISIQAKLDTQDKSEFESRKALFTARLYSKYLGLRMKNEVQKNERIEKVYQDLRKITNQTDLNLILYKISNKEKTFNMAIAGLTEKQNTVNKVRDNVKKIKAEFEEMKNNIFKIDAGKDYLYPMLTDSSKIIEPEEEEILELEGSLRNKLLEKRKIQEKMKLIYVQVKKNINQLLAGQDLLKNPKSLLPQNSKYGGLKDLSAEITDFVENEDELLKLYKQFITIMNESAKKTFLSHNKFEHLEILRNMARDNKKTKKDNRYETQSTQASKGFNEKLNLSFMETNIQNSIHTKKKFKVHKRCITMINDEYDYNTSTGNENEENILTFRRNERR